MHADAELRSEAQGPARARAVERLTSRRDSLTWETSNQERLFEGQRADLGRRLAALRFEEGHLARETSLQRERLQLAQTAQRRDTEMRARDLIWTAPLH